MLFDRDEDGVLSFQELQLVMKSMGQRPPGKVLIARELVINELRGCPTGECEGDL